MEGKEVFCHYGSFIAILLNFKRFRTVRESLRQAQAERGGKNMLPSVRPELVEGLIERFHVFRNRIQSLRSNFFIQRKCFITRIHHNQMIKLKIF